ncbi:hypothetical protein GIB67_041037 [Kingdonia uniflora]|uniref:Uncharacterized protein n=1 Tax=Kingdonia uniflora TaxID=39325 RepID=A0A7J7LG96_9MAGN|nr:hypothetical protein GIB67_041037 [Kingdonia uniflora]
MFNDLQEHIRTGFKTIAKEAFVSKPVHDNDSHDSNNGADGDSLDAAYNFLELGDDDRRTSIDVGIYDHGEDRGISIDVSICCMYA